VVTQIPADTDAAASMLRNDQLDAAFFVMAPTSPLMEELIADDDLAIFNYLHADAYARRFPSLSAVTLTRGTLDIPRDVPPAETQLIAARATLVGRSDLHPDLARLFVESLPAVLPYPLVGEPRAFPSLAQTRFPVNEEARRYLIEGRTPLEDYLPFEIASPLSRWYLVILPLLVLIVPIVGVARGMFNWWMSSRVVGYYPRIASIERNLGHSSLQELDDQLTYLHGLEHQLPTRTRVTAGYMSAYFQLQSHISYVIGRVESRRAELVARDEEPAAATAPEPSVVQEPVVGSAGVAAAPLDPGTSSGTSVRQPGQVVGPGS
jgi:hypothetical protein